MLPLSAHVKTRLARQSRRREVRRLKEHFRIVVGELEGRDTSSLTEEQRAKRARNVDVLRAYALRGRFPKNRDFPDRMVPYFVDGDGTHCAMAHLIDRTGGSALVEHVVHTRNHAFVPELADEPALVAWLDDEGISLHEAARIQPAYCSTLAEVCLCQTFAEGVIEVVVELDDAEQNVFRVTAVHGRSAHAVDNVLAELLGLSFAVQVGDALIATDDGYTVYGINQDGSVDTSTCQSYMYGPPPESAPKDAVIANLLGACGEGLDSNWTTPLGGGCGEPTTASSNASSSSSSTATGSGSTSSGGSNDGGGGGEGGGDAGASPSGGCSAGGGDTSFPGMLALASVLLGGAIHLRNRRVRTRRPRR